MNRTAMIIFLVCISGGIALGQTKYAITDLGPLSERTAQSAVWRINDAGAAAVTMPANDPYVHAARWSSFLGTEDLGAASATSSSVARAINYSGDVAGWAMDATGAEKAVVWRAGQLNFLGLPGTASHAMDINDAGQVVGDYAAATGSRAFLWDPIAGGVDLGMLPNSASCFATAVNRYQDVVGYCVNPSALYPLKAFIWDRQSGMRAVLPKFSGSTVAFGINNLRQVVGYAQDKASYTAFTSDLPASRTVYLPAPRAARGSSQYSVAYGVNEAGTVTGEANGRAFLYQQGKQYDLNTLITDSRWTLVTAQQLNGAGQIVGVGNFDGRRHGFLLTPVR